jgi:hypothetical protein
LGRYTEWGAFFQDEFKVNPKLTLNYGIRYALTTVATDKNGLFFNFDPKIGSIVVPDQQALAAVVPGWPTTVPVITAAEAGFPTDLRAGDHNNFYPRLGFAYRPFASNNTVIRAGYGIYAFPLSFGVLQTGGPFTLTETFNNSSSSNGTPAFAFPAPFPSTPGSVPTPSVTAIAENFRVPYTQQWNLTVEREIEQHTGLRISYVGTKDTQLGYRRNINKPLASTVPFSASRLPYPDLVNVISVENGGNGSYNALDASLTRQMSSGLQFKTGWTWAKGLSDVSMSRFENETGSLIENPYCRKCERGDGEYVPRHKWVTEFVWDIPVGRGRKFLNTGTGAMNQIIGGWTVSGLIGVHSAPLFTPLFSGGDPSNTNTFGGRPDLLPGCDPNLSNPTHAVWFNVSCFVVPPSNAGRFGNAGRGILKGPGATTMDMSLFKTFPINERLRLRLWTSFANLFNHPAWAPPQNNITAPNAGQIYSQTSTLGLFHGYYSRRIQFDLALDW